MSDGAYALVDALTCLALILLLWTHWRRGRAMKRLIKLLKEEEEKKAKAEAVAAGAESEKQ